MVSKDTIRGVLHMYITELETPAVLLDLDIAEKIFRHTNKHVTSIKNHFGLWSKPIKAVLC